MKAKRITVMCFAVINAFFVVLVVFSIFHYYFTWDESGPGQTRYGNSQGALYKEYKMTEEYKRIRLKYDDILLRTENYRVLPASCLLLGISAILLWKCKN